MRKSKAETAETRQRIVEVAAGLFRANGIHATGLADVMATAGLSHGGFYRHFESKDQLVAEACEQGLIGIVGNLEAAAQGCEGHDAFNAVVDAYLSTSHRNAPERGCPLAGMGSELARADEGTRAAAVRGFDALVDMLATRLGSAQDEADRSRATFALAAMIGGMTMARIMADPEASAALLQDIRQQIESI
ncbi:TetR/AcrR family transcriptional regulator [Paraburkholderia acidisoli]|uniref:TetR family transcriptional regulator n=1 Tax=Paraburkholderia acidisoli TaxID=2571748 RepID=A0A7Z2GP55_9BURK|nr:TetR family transcriptional regulator [Paraburkholderia acidisoli]QGZ65370.1 TetR family transcriptional regulator [Paraburkholderia acidisoli]